MGGIVRNQIFENPDCHFDISMKPIYLNTHFYSGLNHKESKIYEGQAC